MNNEAPNPQPQMQPNPTANTMKKMIGNPASLLLRIGLAFVFLYAAFFVSNVGTGTKYVPAFVSNIIPLQTFLILFGVFEVFLSIWLLLGKFTKYSGLVSAVFLICVTAFNLSYFSGLFRNVAIIAAAFALATLRED